MSCTANEVVMEDELVKSGMYGWLGTRVENIMGLMLTPVPAQALDGS